MSASIYFVGIVIVVTIVSVAIWNATQRAARNLRRSRVRGRRGTLLQLKPGLELTLSPAEQKAKTAAVMEQFVQYTNGWQGRLEGTEPAYSLEIHATGQKGYGIYLWTPEEDSRLMNTTLGAKYELPYAVEGEDPLARIAAALADEEGYSRNPGFFTGEFRLAAPYHLPLREWLPGKDPDDPMEAIYGILDAFREKDGVAGFILTMKPADSDWRAAGIGYIDPGQPGGPDEAQIDAFRRDEISAVLAKTKQHAFEAVLRLYSTDREIYQLMKNTVESRFRSEHNGLVLRETRVSLRDMEARWFDRSDMVLSLGEIASVFHFPDCRTRAERLQRGASRSAMPPEGLPIVPEGCRTDIFSTMEKFGVAV